MEKGKIVSELNSIDEYFQRVSEEAKEDLKTNKDYFSSLFEAYKGGSSNDLVMYNPATHSSIDGKCLPLALIPNNERQDVTEYKTLAIDLKSLGEFELVLCKMHAGLGSSVKRVDHLAKYTNRETLGSKGTDLFLELDDEAVSLAELQFIQSEKLQCKKLFKSLSIINVVNEETLSEVEKIENKYRSKIRIKPPIKQLKVPTINEKGNLTTERLAPAGHGLVGYSLLLDIFRSPKQKNIISIGNGEDLNSTVDAKISSWMIRNKIPVAMITTTKLERDKKGGQISIEKNGDKSSYTIVEKAQAEKANQLVYFEQLGLRDSDFESLFNTNIVVINTEVLKEKLNLASELNEEKFKKCITPFVIKNTKTQKGEEFIQLEGALGSVMLNLDKYFRTNHNTEIVHFLNLDANERTEFFIPIKKFEDFQFIQKNYAYSKASGRLEKL